MDNFHINSTDIALHKIMIEAPICNMDSRTSTGFVFISSSMRVIFRIFLNLLIVPTLADQIYSLIVLS